MKALKVIGNIIVGIILFGLIFLLTFTRSTKNFLEKDLILGAIKGKIVDTIKEESGKITDKSKELIDDMLKDDESSNVVRMVIDNFENFQNDRVNFKISDQDVEKIYSYAMKYKKTIVEISGKKVKDMTDAEFKKIFSSENINKLANEVFGSIDNEVGDGIDVAITIYGKSTSKKAMVALIISIVFFIILLMLINWSLYKWMNVTGIVLIISGVLISLVYVAGLLFNDIIGSIDFIKEGIGDINLTGYIVWGMFEIVLGIILIILYNVFKKKEINNPVSIDKLETSV